MKRIPIILVAAAACFCGCTKEENPCDASGVFEATEVIVCAKSQGEILHLGADEGDLVRPGDTLACIDVQQLEWQRRQLQAGRQANDARRLDLTRQIDAVRRQIANAQREKLRFEALFREKAATQKQVDDIAYEISTLEAQLAALTEQINSQNASLEHQGDGIDSQIGQLDVQLSDAVLTAPLGGTILQRYCEPGEYATPGRPLFKVGDISHLKLRAYVDAARVTHLRIGQSATVYADMGTDGRKAYKGKITWISQQAEFTPKTIQTRDERANLVYAVKISVQNDGLIKTGMYGDVVFE